MVAREGENAYQIEVKPGFLMGAHRGALKAHTPEKFSDNSIQLFYHRRTPADPEGAPDEFILEEVLGHEEIGGKMFFKVKWQGWEDPTLEPAGNFFQRFSGPLIQYGLDKGVHMDIFRELAGRGRKSEASGGRLIKKGGMQVVKRARTWPGLWTRSCWPG